MSFKVEVEGPEPKGQVLIRELGPASHHLPSRAARFVCDGLALASFSSKVPRLGVNGQPA